MSCHGGRSASARAEAEVACEDGMLEGIAARIGRHDPAKQRVTPRGGVGESLQLGGQCSAKTASGGAGLSVVITDDWYSASRLN